MMDCTDRHDRYFLRLIAPHVLLYTEMITANALMHGDYAYLLAYDEKEHPLALQLGGSIPKDLAYAAKLGEDFGYDEINLNVGCPSDRVKSGQFGACLMLNPTLVGDCVAAMRHAVKLPVTVKCRIGVDEHDSYAALHHFIKTIAEAGCEIVIIHARKAWLNGLSPKENREIPPLRYEVVRQVKQDFPALQIILNGGVKTLADIQAHLSYCDGVMIGREAYANPYCLAEIEQQIFHNDQVLTRFDVIKAFMPYVHHHLQHNIRLSTISRHLFGLFHGQRNGRVWRRFLSENACRMGAGVEILGEALDLVEG